MFLSSLLIVFSSRLLADILNALLFSCMCQIAAMPQMNTTATLTARTLAGQLNQN